MRKKTKKLDSYLLNFNSEERKELWKKYRTMANDLNEDFSDLIFEAMEFYAKQWEVKK